MNGETKHLYVFGPFRFDPEERLLMREGKPVPLSPKLTATLFLLVQNGGHLVDKDELMKRVWPDAFVEDGNLNKNISVLRRTLGRWDGGREYIETVPKRGYRFVASVNQVEEEDRVLPPQIPVGAKESIPGSRMQWLRTQKAIGILLLLALTVFAAGGILWSRRTRRFISNVPSIRSLAVLPFENLSGDTSQDYFADGMTDELITNLGRIGSLRVISRTSVMQYRGVHKPLPQIASELKVDAIVEGTVVRSGGQVRITAQLIQAPADKHLWAQSYESDLKNVLALQREIANAITKQVRNTLTPGEQIRAGIDRPVNLEAYESYLKGEYFLNKVTPDSIHKAADYFQEAIERDPNYPAAYTKLAGCYQILAVIGEIPNKVAYPKANLLVAKALELDPQFAAAHAVRGWRLLLYDLDFTAAGAEFKRAIELNPNGVEGHQGLGDYYASMGQVQESVQEMQHARELDPLAVIVNDDLCKMLFFARQYDEALAQCKANLDLAPNSVGPLLNVGDVYAAKGMDSEAVSALLHALPLMGASPTMIAALKTGASGSGLKGFWRAMIQFMPENVANGVDPVGVAMVYAHDGNTDKALLWLERATQTRGYGINYLGVNPVFDELRSNPRFISLVRQIGLPQSQTRN